MFSQLLFGVVDELISLVFQINDLFGFFILSLVSFSFIDHTLNISIRKTARSANSNVLLLSSRFVFSADIQNTVSIDVESDFDLGVSTRCHRDACELKITKFLVIFSEFTLTLENGDTDFGLIVSSG